MAARGERPRQRLVHPLGEQQAVDQHHQARTLAVGGVGEAVAVVAEAPGDLGDHDPQCGGWGPYPGGP